MQGPQECRLDNSYMTSAEVIFSLPSLKDSNYICKDTGPLGCFQGGCFLRHVAFISTEPPFPSLGAPGLGNTYCT